MLYYAGFRSMLYSILKPSSTPSRVSEISSGLESTAFFNELQASLNPSRLTFRARSALSRVSVFYPQNLSRKLSDFSVWESYTKNKRIYYQSICLCTGYAPLLSWTKISLLHRVVPLELSNPVYWFLCICCIYMGIYMGKFCICMVRTESSPVLRP